MAARQDDHETQQITITALAHGGDGVGHLEDGRVIFVPDTIPGEEVSVRITSKKRSHAFGEVADLLTAADVRVVPGCQHAKECGGCQLRHIDSQSAFSMKANAALESMRRIGKFEDLPEAKLHAAPSLDGWRTRATLHARSTRGGFLLGFHEGGSHRIVNVESCPQLHPDLEAARELLIELLPPVVERAEVFIESAGGGQVVATISVIKRSGNLSRRDCIQHFEDALGEGAGLLRGVMLDFGQNSDGVEVGEPFVDASVALTDVPDAHARVGLPAGLFRQANAELNRALVARVTELASASKPKRVLELFSGIGNLTFPLASKTGAEVIAIEAVRQCVELGEQLTELLGVQERVQFIKRDLFDVHGLSHKRIELERADLVVLDPPRAGAIEVCKRLAGEASLGRIVYISCEPSRLVRDMAALIEGGFTITSLDLFDMFPGTSHLEVIAVLERA